MTARQLLWIGLVLAAARVDAGGAGDARVADGALPTLSPPR
jgi:hypothetical protein